LAGWGLGVGKAGDQEGEADEKDGHDTDGDESAVMAIHGTPAGGVRDAKKRKQTEVYSTQSCSTVLKRNEL